MQHVSLFHYIKVIAGFILNKQETNVDIKTEIRNFIVENFLYGDDSGNLGAEDSFFEKGIVDSTGVLSIINFVEEHFNISVSDVEITPENFDSINRITAYTERKFREGNKV